jgi:hypothetical protein
MLLIRKHLRIQHVWAEKIMHYIPIMYESIGFNITPDNSDRTCLCFIGFSSATHEQFGAMNLAGSIF